MQKNNKKTKLTVLLLALMMLVGCVVGGTLAWLVAETDPVVNTFTVGNITLTLTETPNAKSATDKTDNDIWQGKLVPGTTLKKDPVVTVGAGSEACWVFVKIEKTDVDVALGEGTEQKNYSFSDFIEYEVRTGTTEWEKIEVAGVDYELYARKHTGTDAQSYYVLTNLENTNEEFKNGCVQIPETVTKDMVDGLGTTTPKLTFTAYAIQSEGLKTAEGNDVISAAEAWAVYTTPSTQQESNN